MSDAVPVLFIVGTGRSGSTLLGNLLGSVPGAVSIGEARHIWRRGLHQGWNCGCGASFEGCSFWQAVLQTAFPDGFDLGRLLTSERELLRFRNSWRSIRWARHPEWPRRRHPHYVDALSRLYRAIHQVSGARLIVDASKTPSYAAVLSSLPNLDLRLLHLIRDPRATAYSWANPKASPDRPGRPTMDRLGTAKSTLLWAWWNHCAGALIQSRATSPHLTVTYERLMDQPRRSLEQVIDRLAPELSGQKIPLSGRTIELVQSHSVSGNPDRMQQGAVALARDERWRGHFGARHRATVLAIGGLAMRRYGYWSKGRAHIAEGS